MALHGKHFHAINAALSNSIQVTALESAVSPRQHITKGIFVATRQQHKSTRDRNVSLVARRNKCPTSHANAEKLTCEIAAISDTKPSSPRRHALPRPPWVSRNAYSVITAAVDHPYRHVLDFFSFTKQNHLASWRCLLPRQRFLSSLIRWLRALFTTADYTLLRLLTPDSSSFSTLVSPNRLPSPRKSPTPWRR